MSIPIYDYLAQAEGRTWTAEDSAFVRDKFRQVEAVASKVIERRCAEMERLFRRQANLRPLDVVGTNGGKDAAKVEAWLEARKARR